MTNPYQEAHAEDLTFPEAVRAIAERTPFRTEEEQNAVYRAVDKAIAEFDQPDQTDAEPDPEAESEPDPPAPPATARKAAKAAAPK